MIKLAKEKIHPDTPKSGETDQDFNFWDKPETWDKHLTSEKEALRSFDEMEARRNKLSPFERRYTSNQLERQLGKQGAIEAILNDVRKGNPPITGIRSGKAQLEFKFLNA